MLAACVFVFLTVTIVGAQTGGLQLLYSSAKAGPNQGWAGSATKGAAITVWARNVGTVRGGSYITVAGVNLTSDSDYAEWGATTNPTTAKGFQRITFWLNGNMPAANTAGISVTVNGITSIALPFTIDNTGGGIFFADGTNGNDSWDGRYPDHSLGGSHGPWLHPFTVSIRTGEAPGEFIYMRNGTYTNICNGCSDTKVANIGYFEEGGANCTIYNPQINGTDALHYTVTSYPGELATLSGVSINAYSNYWTFTNFRMTNTGQAISLGNEWSFCSDCHMHQTGLDVIGMMFDGPFFWVGQKFADNTRWLANYHNSTPTCNTPTYSCSNVGTAYVLYWGSGDTTLVKDNEFHGGAMYQIHNYDENRCNATDLGRNFTNETIDSNLFDITRSAGNPQDMRAAILTGMDQNGAVYNNVTISNNVVYSRDNLVSLGMVYAFTDPGWNLTANGLYLYNNTFDAPGAPYFFTIGNSGTTAHWSNVVLQNNIAVGETQYEIFNDSLPNFQYAFQYNLVPQTPRTNSSGTVSNNIVGAPTFVNASTQDFHLQSGSLGIDQGTTLSSITVDYDGTTRPQGTAYDMGAFEYGSGTVTRPSPPTNLSAVVH